MIPERYRQMMPPYWYENEVAEYHFEGTASAVDAFHAQREDLQQQLTPWSATWGLDIWDWIYFGKKQLLSVEERRKNILRKHWARLPFTLPVLRAMGQAVGKLEKVTEDFANKEVVFEFSDSQPVNLLDLSKDFERIRPIHVNCSKAVVNSRGEDILVSVAARFFEVDYILCGTFSAEDDLEGRIYKESVMVGEAARTNTVDHPLTNTFYSVPE
ncbi:putative phage tail protein [Brevibacillus sp. SAFN-007a]|uniref:putative phage tail protein n=1 Tax=Brevibacillus sp. SAFN-007a TaxID=3436862 RepID=UPI003F806885